MNTILAINTMEPYKEKNIYVLLKFFGVVVAFYMIIFRKMTANFVHTHIYTTHTLKKNK